MHGKIEDAVLVATQVQAAEWFAVNRDPARTASQNAEFWAWLQESPLNVREYLEVATLARELGSADGSVSSADDLVAEALSSSADVVVPLHEAPPDRIRRRRLWPSIAAAATVVAFAIFVATFLGAGDSEATYMTEHGEQRVLRLADNSVVHLNSQSAVDVRFTRDERNVELRYGQALFSVARDAARPFRVTAGTADVVAIGTEFEVYRRDGETLVTVIEGKVAVHLDRSQAGGASAEFPAIPLEAGRRVRLAAAGQPSAPEAIDAQKAVAWAQRQIVFEARPVSAVVEEFNRYGRVSIVVDDPRIADERISGVFNAYDTDSFVEFLRRMDGVIVVERRGELHVTTSRETTSADPE